MKKYEFRLTPGYCRKKGIAVLEQNGASIKFLIRNLDDEMTKQTLRKAFCSYLNYVRKQKDCETAYRKLPKVDFIGSYKLS